MSKAIREHYKHYSEDFRLRMLSEYYDSGMSIYAFAKKHGIDRGTFLRWTKTHESEKVYKDENAQLKKRIKELEKALEFSRLETLARDMMIDKAEDYYDIPIRKKSGAK